MEPLAQSYTIVAKSPEPYVFCFEPGIVKLPSGRLMVTFPYLSPPRRHPEGYAPTLKCPQMNTFISDDRGASWHPKAAFHGTIGKAFVVDDQLYLIWYRPDGGDVVISRSDDEGESWTPEVTLFEGKYWNCPSCHAISNGHLYWALGRQSADPWSGKQGDPSYPRDDLHWSLPGAHIGGRDTMAIAGDLSRDLLDPASWRMSNVLPFPGMPPELAKDGKVKCAMWLEPNVVEVKGGLLVLSTVKIFSDDGTQTSGMAAVCELEDDGQGLDYRFVQFYPTPGGQLKSCIVYDDVSRLYWRTMNLPASVSGDEWGDFGPGDRRMLCLSYSIDALNWMTAGCIAITANAWEGFQYAVPLVDGDDLLVVSRTSLAEDNLHDANLMSLHRVPEFRSLVLEHFRPCFSRPSLT